jgi:hypothetical protein
MTILTLNGIEALYTPDALEIADSTDQFVEKHGKQLLSNRQQLLKQLAATIRQVLTL